MPEDKKAKGAKTASNLPQNRGTGGRKAGNGHHSPTREGKASARGGQATGALACRSLGAGRDAPLQIVPITIDEIQPNPWNANRMTTEIEHKLREYIRMEGLVEPIVVRRKNGHFEILGGEHRWKICKELGFREMPCIVLTLDDRRAKVLSINLNEMKGSPAPDLLAELVHSLNKEITLEDLESMLPYSLSELKDSLNLLKIPEGLEKLIDEQTQKEMEEAPIIVTFIVDNDEYINRAIEHIAGKLEGKNLKGRALEILAEEYCTRNGLNEEKD